MEAVGKKYDLISGCKVAVYKRKGDYKDAKNIKKNKLSTKIYKYYFVQIVYNIVTLKGIFREES